MSSTVHAQTIGGRRVSWVPRSHHITDSSTATRIALSASQKPDAAQEGHGRPDRIEREEHQHGDVTAPPVPRRQRPRHDEEHRRLEHEHEPVEHQEACR
jgi:hypothetical protein